MNRKKVFRLQHNHWLPWCPLWISSLWIRCRIISHGLIQSAILNACATGHYSGEDRLSVIVSLISNWRLVIFMQLLVAQTSLCVCVCVRISCVHLCLQTSVAIIHHDKHSQVAIAFCRLKGEILPFTYCM